MSFPDLRDAVDVRKIEKEKKKTFLENGRLIYKNRIRERNDEIKCG